MALPHHVLDQADRKVLPLVALRAVELVHEVHRLLVNAPGILPKQSLEANGTGPLYFFGSTWRSRAFNIPDLDLFLRILIIKFGLKWGL